MENAKGELVPGGLAMVIKGESTGETCTIVRLLVDNLEKHDLGDGCYSKGDNDGSLSAVVEFRDEERYLFSQSYLMPIKPEADPLHTEQEKCMTA
jgi:hypothetical protein